VDADDQDDVEDPLLVRSDDHLSCEVPTAIPRSGLGKAVASFALTDPWVTPSLNLDDIDLDESEQIRLSEPFPSTPVETPCLDVNV
jgi:hypothetical protein